MEALIALLVVLAIPTLIGGLIACFSKGGGWLLLISLIPAINGIAFVAFFVIGLLAIWWFLTEGHRELREKWAATGASGGASETAVAGDERDSRGP